MQKNRSMNLLLTVGISILLLLGFIVPNVPAAVNRYPDDGIWEDSFTDATGVILKNCSVKPGEIILNQEYSQISYDFAKTNQNHQAYAYQTFFFIPLWRYLSPNTHLSKEIKFGANDLFRIKQIDQEYAERTSSIIKPYVVHHYRFKIDIDEETIDSINVIWHGKADATARVDFYFYNSDYLLLGGWDRLGYNRSDGTDFSVNFSIPSDAVEYAINDDNYLDISIVSAFPISRKVCSLSTNYIELQAVTEKGYTLKKASAETFSMIDPINISTTFSSFYWETLTWDDYQPEGTEIRYQVLYRNQTGKLVEVENTTLPGNHQGFKTPPIYLNNLSNSEFSTKYNKLKIRATLWTTTPSVSPRIFSWAITWQNKSCWQDTFHTYYRIDERTKVTKENGTIMISLVQDEWPLFGFDSGNTRASGSKAATTNNLYWFSGEYVGGSYRNPVVGNGKVYILSDKRSLHQYNVVLPSGVNEGDPQVNISSVNFAYNVVNSPAVTDEYVIVATGQMASGGSENKIYAYETNNLTRQWEYSADQKICYDASPVISADTIYITTWGGDNGSYVIPSNRYTNNKLLALDLKTGQKRWEYTLPAPSYSTPAVSDELIIVGCSSTANESVIAVNLNGEKIWSKGIGVIGHASPVIYQDTVFITSQQIINKKGVTKIIALNLDTGDYLWNVTVSEISNCKENLAESTPAVYEDVLYVASPDGTAYALDVQNGTTVWSKKIYTLPFLSCDVVRSSPAYADSHVYLGTPAGKVYAFNAATGDIAWEYETFPIWTAAPVLGSPVVSNGLVFIADENGVLYGLGKFTISTKAVSGRIISLPIRLPEALWWNTFYADVLYNSSLSSIKFKLLDEAGNFIKDVTNKSVLTGANKTLGRTVRLQADFSASNISRDNPKLLRWYITLTADTQKPWLNSSSFTPDPKGWLQEIVPVFTIKVKDNITGLLVKSARYTLEYTLNNVSQTSTALAVCTGQNGTRDEQTLTMNISALPFFNNITSLSSLTVSISDLAGNTASKTVTFKQDVKKPTSHIKEQMMKKKYNSSFVRINATANDTGTLNVDASGIKSVELYYRYSTTTTFSGDWAYFADSTKTQPTWLFNFTNSPSQQGGYFELCTIAIDNASNIEDFPSTGDISFLYDWKEPSPPSFSSETLWFNERPQFSVIFRDDFRLDTIQYRPNFETLWTTIASRVNSSTYNTDGIGQSWVLKQEYWDLMIEDEVYYLYFKINDTLGNALLVTSDNDAIIIRKDISPPVIDIVPSVETEWTWDDNFTVSGIGDDQNGSGIKEAFLYYRFSEDKSNWSSWTVYGDIIDSAPYEWRFQAQEGDGYYEVKINVMDYAGNTKESDVFSVAVASFPTMLALVLIGLVVLVVCISFFIYAKWRKKK